jgi:hypothetical protein
MRASQRLIGARNPCEITSFLNRDWFGQKRSQLHRIHRWRVSRGQRPKPLREGGCRSTTHTIINSIDRSRSADTLPLAGRWRIARALNGRFTARAGQTTNGWFFETHRSDLMNRARFRWFAMLALALVTTLAASGCTETDSVTFLDVLNTIFLGITAAGGIVLIQNV